MSMAGDELVHVIKQIVNQAVIEFRSIVYAHVSDYDPIQHCVRVIVPSMRDDQTNAPLHSGWLPFGSPLVGSESGVQVVPQGGATSENPTAGELALVHLNERGSGVAAVSCLFYTGAQKTPNSAIDVADRLKPGEILIQQASGSSVRFRQNGNIDVVTAGDGDINLTTNGAGNIQLLTTGSGTTAITSRQSVNIEAPTLLVVGDIHATGEIIRGLGGSDQVSVGQHQHGDPQGGVTTVPNPGT